ncbi:MULTISPECIES: GW dipeptide domain-containing protein [Bacillaceae]|uniref:GW dipeptide domain-containing protein n=1 Tax=Metabacillus sediminis TaxID=3117746 RepID=A0ABZ2NFJ9_9BACI|nr:GW dipeptide domain-containing protein [Bacillus sp. SJS]KZZ85013.1 hypothetical protein AS29_008160 [Bacillus sp. SJS]
MKKMKIALIFGAGIIAGSIFTPLATSQASSNLVLASVEWVTSQLTPINNRVASLEREVQTLKQMNTNPALPSKVYVKAVIADVHSGAMEHYRVLASIPVSQILNVSQEITSEDGKYYRVEYSTGNTGWIPASEVSTAPVAKPASFIVKTPGAVYSGASVTGYKKVGSVSEGQTLKYVNAFKNRSTKEVWINVQLSNGTKGWVKQQSGEVK